MSQLPALRGQVEAHSSLADFIWFRTGGAADYLVRPADIEDLAQFLKALPADVPVLPVGVGSNLIVRDGGVAGVVIRLPKSFADVNISGDVIEAGAAAMGITVASSARDAALGGLEFLRGIPGTVGGAVRMNAGAYGREMADILIDCTIVTRAGEIQTLPASALQYSYRHSSLPQASVVVSARLRGTPGDVAAISAEMDRIAAAREESQPLRARTGGSTFRNPQEAKAWELIDAIGFRGKSIGDAQISQKHCNFLINNNNARSKDLIDLGEEARKKIFEQFKINLEWEIKILK